MTTQPTLAELSGREPDDVAIEVDDRRLSWADLESRSTAFAHGLEAMGVHPGDHIALCLSNRVEFVEALIGAWRAGCAYTPLKTSWTAGEVDPVLADAGTAVVITDRPGARQAAALRDIPVIDLSAGGGVGADLTAYDDWLAAQSVAPLPADRAGYKLPYTSGTTGRPKGVKMAGAGQTPFPAAWSGAARWAQALRLPGEGVHLFASRLFNGAPQTFGFATLAAGATLRILPTWDARAALAALAAPDVTSTILVPTMMRQLLLLDGVDRSAPPGPALRTVVHGGEPCPTVLKEAFAAWFGEVLVEYYGFTEGGFTIAGPDDWRQRPGTVGRPLPGMRIRILDDTGDDLVPGQTGTVFFEPQTGRRFSYLGDDAKTESSHRGDSFTVGDIGWVDDDGFLFLAGRSADVVVSAGVNVYPAEVEQALADVTGVADMCAVGIPDPLRGERIGLHVVLAAGAVETDVTAALEAAAERRLAPYKRPATIWFDTSVPRDETGKLLRRVVRDAAVTR
jgi:long-chain acyl-CoA synthetase